MSELLVFCRHYSDDGGWANFSYEQQISKTESDSKLTPEQIMKQKTIIENNHLARSQPGDITAEYEDGWWDNVVMKNPESRMLVCYSCVKIPGVKPLGYLAKRTAEPDEVRHIYPRRNMIIDAPAAGIVEERTVVSAGIYDKLNDRLVVLNG